MLVVTQTSSMEKLTCRSSHAVRTERNVFEGGPEFSHENEWYSSLPNCLARRLRLAESFNQ